MFDLTLYFTLVSGRELYSNSPRTYTRCLALSSTKRALTAVAVLVTLLAAAVAGFYLYVSRQPTGGPATPPPPPPLPGVATAKPPDLLSELPPDAPAIAYIDAASLRTLKDSPLAAVLGLTSPGPQADREYAEFVRQTGFDYARDLDKAAVAFWPQSFYVAAGSGIGENRVLAIADGRFNQEKIKAYAVRTGKAIPSTNPVVYEVPGNPAVYFEFVSPTRIALASGRGARNVLSQPLTTSRPDAAMKARMNRVAGAPIFAVARTDNLPRSFYSNFQNAPQLEKLARSVRGLSFASKPDGNLLPTALDAECDSIKSAMEISTLLDGFRMVGSMALSDPKTLQQMTKEQAAFVQALIRKLKITRQDRWVRLRLDITPEMLGATHHASTAPSP